MNQFLIEGEYQAPLSKSIRVEYTKLIKIIFTLPKEIENKKCIEFSRQQISLNNLVAYQIGWGKLLMSWYLAGIEGKMPAMPGEGMTVWNYKALAECFYLKYSYENSHKQYHEFYLIVKNILEIVEKEYQTGQLDQLGIWPWCRLKSGKQWPLSKWIKVNTVSPYKRACLLIKTIKC